MLYLCDVETSKAILDIIIGFGFNNNVVCKQGTDGNQSLSFFRGRSGVSRPWLVQLSFDLDDHSPVGRQCGSSIVGQLQDEVYGLSCRVVLSRYVVDAYLAHELRDLFGGCGCGCEAETKSKYGAALAGQSRIRLSYEVVAILLSCVFSGCGSLRGYGHLGLEVGHRNFGVDGIFDFRGGAGVVVGQESGGDDAQYDNDAGERPSGFFEEVGRLGGSHNLVRRSEARCQASAFGILYQNDEYEAHSCNKNQNGDEHVHGYSVFMLIINFSRNRIWSAK